MGREPSDEWTRNNLARLNIAKLEQARIIEDTKRLERLVQAEHTKSIYDVLCAQHSYLKQQLEALRAYSMSIEQSLSPFV